MLLVFYVMDSTPGANNYGPRSQDQDAGAAAQRVAARHASLEEELTQLYELQKTGAMSLQEYQQRRNELFSRR